MEGIIYLHDLAGQALLQANERIKQLEAELAAEKAKNTGAKN